MAYRSLHSRTCAAIACSLLACSALTSLAHAETLMYGKEPRKQFSANRPAEPNDPNANPYQNRRTTSRTLAVQEKQEALAAPAVPARKPQANAPMRITIPNLEQLQPRHARNPIVTRNTPGYGRLARDLPPPQFSLRKEPVAVAAPVPTVSAAPIAPPSTRQVMIETPPPPVIALPSVQAEAPQQPATTTVTIDTPPPPAVTAAAEAPTRRSGRNSSTGIDISKAPEMIVSVVAPLIDAVDSLIPSFKSAKPEAAPRVIAMTPAAPAEPVAASAPISDVDTYSAEANNLFSRKPVNQSAAEEPAQAQEQKQSLPQTDITLADITLADATPLKKQILYKSPDIVIQKRVEHLTPPPSAQLTEAEVQRFATLSPAAGEPSPSLVPLIQIPDPDATRQESREKPEEQQATPTVIVPEKPVAPVVMPEPTVAAPPPPVAPPLPADSQSSASSGSGFSAPDSSVLLDDILKKAGVTPPVSETPKANASKPTKENVSKTNTLPEITEASPEKGTGNDNSEPPPGLSAESKNILSQIPRVAQKPYGSADPVKIEHIKKTQDLFSPDSTDSSARHESMGVKIEVKNRTINFDHDLENAYNALIAGQSEAAIAIYKNVLDNDADNKQALFGLATTYHRAGQLDLARPLYGRLLALDPQSRDGLNNFLVLLADEAPEEALGQLEKLEEKNPGFSPIPAQMAVIYQKLGHTDKASDKMLKAIALAPENLTYRYNFAIMLDKEGKYDEAARLYRQLMDAYRRGENIPGNVQKIQERLTFISSNRH